jgi:two-component system CheB/CheR fusion protein
VLSLFHFALQPDGILLLGNSETPASVEGRFEIVSQADRIYRRVGPILLGDLDLHRRADLGARRSGQSTERAATSVQTMLAELCERALLDGFAPAAALVDLKHQCLHFSGATSRYLKVSQGPATHGLLPMVAAAIRPRLRAALHRSAKERSRVSIPGGHVMVDGLRVAFDIDVRPVAFGAETLLLVSFADRPSAAEAASGSPDVAKASHVLDLEHDMDVLREDLQDALHEIELAHEQQKIASEEALSINEEYQSTNEELLTSKEELQSLNDELTALNAQLHETLDRERTTSNDLQNVLFSTDVATLFLDKRLSIRFFTPAAKAQFNVLAGDIGRPISDLRLAAADGSLLQDARAVLNTLVPIEKEIEAAEGAWFLRRILPYRNMDAAVGGVVITFVNVTERRHIADALKAAEAQAQKATAAKTRFLAAASHDLRQPLQTLALLHGLLAKTVAGDAEKRLLARLDDTLDAMSSMLNTLLDVNQIEAGIVQAAFQDFPIDDLLSRMKSEFSYHAEAKGLSLRVVHCGASICSDPKLLEQIVRNLLSNALKYTRKGKILLGCRRHRGALSIEIWDTGLGIAKNDLSVIFEEYHQLDNASRERSRGLGLGLAIVQRLAGMLHHRISVRSQPGRGSAFAVEVSLLTSGSAQPAEPPPDRAPPPERQDGQGVVLIVEDDPIVLELLTLYLTGDGHHVEVASDGLAALDLVTRGALRPDLVLTDYNLPLGLSGVDLSSKLRRTVSASLPIIVLSGDISAEALRDIAQADCVHLNKPVKLSELSATIAQLLKAARSPDARHGPAAIAPKSDRPTVFVVDDDPSIRQAMRAVMEEAGLTVEDFASSEAFLRAYDPRPDRCLIVDAYLPGLSGVELLRHLRNQGDALPAIMITGSSDVPIAVQAMKAGAFDFIEKPVRGDELLASVARALQTARDADKPAEWRAAAFHQLAGLTPRQRQIMDLVLAGHPSKNIAADLGISQRTVENHRAAIMKKTGSKSLPALARLAIAADGIEG